MRCIIDPSSQYFTGRPFRLPRSYKLHNDPSVEQYFVQNSTLQLSQSLSGIIGAEPEIIYGSTALSQICKLLRERLIIVETFPKYKQIAEYGYALTGLSRQSLSI